MTGEVLSAEGRRLLYNFEGKKTLLPDGRYAAYRCPAGRPTIYAGCTTGVHMGMVITAEEGERRVDAELAPIEDTINRLVRVPINRNERDALALFIYNVGVGAFEHSNVLAKLNRGDRVGAAHAMNQWNKAHVNGVLTTLGGLTSRRARECALMLKPTAEPDAPFMPQVVVKSAEPMHPAVVATGGVTIAGLFDHYAHQFLEALGMGDVSIPDGLSDQALGLLSTPGAKQGAAHVWTGLTHSPAVGAALLFALALIWGPSLWRKAMHKSGGG